MLSASPLMQIGSPWAEIIIVLAAYLVGGIPFGWLIAKLAKTFQKDPVRIEVARQSQTADTIAQHVVKLARGDDKAKRTALRRVIESREVVNGIVFCNRKREVDIVAKSLTKHGF